MPELDLGDDLTNPFLLNPDGTVTPEMEKSQRRRLRHSRQTGSEGLRRAVYHGRCQYPRGSPFGGFAGLAPRTLWR